MLSLWAVLNTAGGDGCFMRDASVTSGQFYRDYPKDSSDWRPPPFLVIPTGAQRSGGISAAVNYRFRVFSRPRSLDSGRWPALGMSELVAYNTFRVARFIPAVDYINANRLRARAIMAWDKLFEGVDVIVTPTSVAGFPQLVATNLTGHPAVILPHGFRADGTPVSLTFLGALFGEAKLLAVAQAYQDATAYHIRRPPLQPLPT